MASRRRGDTRHHAGRPGTAAPTGRKQRRVISVGRTKRRRRPHPLLSSWQAGRGQERAGYGSWRRGGPPWPPATEAAPGPTPGGQGRPPLRAEKNGGWFPPAERKEEGDRTHCCHCEARRAAAVPRLKDRRLWGPVMQGRDCFAGCPLRGALAMTGEGEAVGAAGPCRPNARGGALSCGHPGKRGAARSAPAMDRGVGEALRGLPPPRRHRAPRRAARDGRPYGQKRTAGGFRRPNAGGKRRVRVRMAVVDEWGEPMREHVGGRLMSHD